MQTDHIIDIELVVLGHFDLASEHGHGDEGRGDIRLALLALLALQGVAARPASGAGVSKSRRFELRRDAGQNSMSHQHASGSRPAMACTKRLSSGSSGVRASRRTFALFMTSAAGVFRLKCFRAVSALLVGGIAFSPSVYRSTESASDKVHWSTDATASARAFSV